MILDDDSCYRAMEARDARFDGRFFVAVRSTRIYCRPICPAPKPKRENCLFVASAAAAEQAGFRACRRCRPEAAPGSPAWAGSAASVSRALRLIEDGALDHASLADLAARLGMGERHLRRLFDHHLGASPKAVAQTHRLHLTKRLIEGTSLPMAEVAQAAGFRSLRRFNDAFVRTFQSPPSAMRRHTDERGRPHHGAPDGAAALTLSLSYRPPYNAPHLFAFLGDRALPGVHAMTAEGDTLYYARTLEAPGGPGLIAIQTVAGHERLSARLWLAAPGDLRGVIRRVRRVFDLDADSQVIDADLARDPLFTDQVAQHPGLRVAGAWDAFEYAARAVMGQQVSVKGARTIATRLTARLGRPLPGTLTGIIPGLTHLFPTAQAVAKNDLEGLGLTRKRAATLRGLAAAFATGTLSAWDNLPPEEVIERLLALPGIGPWTAHMVAMCALGDTDAFPAADLGILKVLDLDLSAAGRKALSIKSEAWRPWRAYAVMRLWAQLGYPP